MAAGLVTLRETERPGFYETLERRTARLVAGIGDAARRRGVPITSGHAGSMGGLYFAPGPVRNFAHAKAADTALFARGHRSALARRLGISAVNVTEARFAMANGRRYRGRVNVIRDPAGLTLMNRVPVEGYLAGVIGGEMGPRRPDERQAMLAQAVVSRTFALKN